VSPDVNVTEVRPVQFWNAYVPNVVIELGIVMEVRPEQFWNALLPIEVNKGFIGNVTEVRFIQFWNA